MWSFNSIQKKIFRYHQLTQIGKNNIKAIIYVYGNQ